MNSPTMPRYRMPAEWEPHRRTWMAWPCRESIWGEHLEAARLAYAEVARTIAAFEPVTMITSPELTARASLELGQGRGVSILPLQHDDSWARDTAPTFVLDGEGRLAGVDWCFNGWGGLTDDFAEDQAMAARVIEHVGAERITSTLTTEGGAIHTDGEGTCVLCEASILDPARNPGWGRPEVERELRRTLGIERVIWLAGMLEDDETGGTVDNVACFSTPGHVLALDPSDATDADRPGLEANLEALRSASDAAERRLEVTCLPMPKPVERHDGRVLTRSYANLYIANGVVILPGFDDAADSAARKIVQAAFPHREVVQIESNAITEGGGGIHSITQQEPATQSEEAS